jgi:hypothetical protein
MPPKQVNTRMIKEALRYKFELGPSLERTAMALKISKGVLAKYVGLSKAAGLDWSQIEAMTEAQLQARLLPGRLADGGNGHYVQPVHGRPRFAKLSIHDGLKVKIAPVHSDFRCGF